MRPGHDRGPAERLDGAALVDWCAPDDTTSVPGPSDALIATAPLSVDDARAAWVRALERGAVDVRHDDDVPGAGPLGACWPFVGARSDGGYGRARAGGRVARTHRVALVAHTGAEIPLGLTVDHLCGSRSCVRPDHLRAVSQRVNTAAASGAAAAAVAARLDTGRCLAGHDDWRPNRSGRGVRCRECERARTRIWNALAGHAATRAGMQREPFVAQNGGSLPALLATLGPDGVAAALTTSRRADLRALAGAGGGELARVVRAFAPAGVLEGLDVSPYPVDDPEQLIDELLVDIPLVDDAGVPVLFTIGGAA